MRQLAGVVAIVCFGLGCSSDAEREAILKKYEDPPLAANPSVATCDRSAAQRVKTLLSSPEMGKESFADGWVVMTFGTDYSAWTTEQRKQMATNFANADACLNGKARRIEFDGPDGTTVGRADEIRGVHFTDAISR